VSVAIGVCDSMFCQKRLLVICIHLLVTFFHSSDKPLRFTKQLHAVDVGNVLESTGDKFLSERAIVNSGSLFSVFILLCVSPDLTLADCY